MTIKQLDENSRPRERAELYGLKALSDIELLAIIIKSGGKGKSAIAIANELISYIGSVKDLSYENIKCMNIKGFGKVKKLEVASCFELARRINSLSEKKNSIFTSLEAYSFFLPHFLNSQSEKFMIVLLDRKHKVIYQNFVESYNKKEVSLSFHKLFKVCTNVIAPYVILAHNHPSGICLPSLDDDETTRAIKISLQLLDVKLLDHLIITDEEFYSYSDHKRL